MRAAEPPGPFCERAVTARSSVGSSTPSHCTRPWSHQFRCSRAESRPHAVLCSTIARRRATWTSLRAAGADRLSVTATDGPSAGSWQRVCHVVIYLSVAWTAASEGDREEIAGSWGDKFRVVNLAASRWSPGRTYRLFRRVPGWGRAPGRCGSQAARSGPMNAIMPWRLTPKYGGSGWAPA